MILTVTLNPLLEKVYNCKSINFNNVNRADESFYRSGGKGINVSRQLNKLGIQNTAITFLGGNNGKILRKILIDENINFISVSTKSETRLASLMYDNDKNKSTTVIEPSRQVSESETKNFIEKLDKAIQNCSIVTFMGSSPSPETDLIIKEGISLAKKYDKFCMVDTYGDFLGDVYDAVPDVIHNNVSEIEKSLKIDLNSETGIIGFLNSLSSKGIKIAFITNGNNITYAMQFGFIFKATQNLVEVVDSQGSGDSFCAGYLYAFDKSEIFKDSLKIAMILGELNASKFEVSNVSLDELKNYNGKIEIEPIGKQIKIIDDSPTC